MAKSIRKLQEGALLALQTAVKAAIAEHTRNGLPVYVWQDGKVVDLNASKKNKPARVRTGLKRPRSKSR